MSTVSRPSVPYVVAERIREDACIIRVLFYSGDNPLDVFEETFEFKLFDKDITLLKKPNGELTRMARNEVEILITDADKDKLSGKRFTFTLTNVTKQRTELQGLLVFIGMEASVSRAIQGAPDFRITYNDSVNAVEEVVPVVRGIPGPEWVNWTGAFAINKNYKKGDGVSNGGNSYRRKADGLGGPVFDATQWDLLAQGGAPANGTVGNIQLSPEVLFKNYPWQGAASPSAVLRNGIRDVKLYNVPAAKQYTIAVFSRNATVSSVANTWAIRVYEWTGSAFGTLVFNWNAVNYTPSSAVENIQINGAGNLLAVVTVDWSQVPDATNLSSMNYSIAGIANLTYRSQSDYDSYISSKVVASIPAYTTSNRLDGVSIINRTETTTIENTQVRDSTNTGISAIGVRFVSNALSFNTFTFPGHSFAHASAIYAFCLLKTTAGIEETHVLPFDSRTTDYKFILSRIFSLSEGVTVVFGYCDANLNTFAPGAALGLAANVADANLAPVVIQYLAGVGSIYANVSNAGSAAWKSTPYKLLITTRIVADPKPATPVIGDKTIGIAKLGTDVATRNLPFVASATPTLIFSTGITQIRLYGVLPSKQYVIAVVKRVAPVWQIRIYEWTGSAFGSLAFEFNTSAGYTPSASIETLTMTGTSAVPAGATAIVTVNWGVIVEGTNLTSINYSVAGISPLVYFPAQTPTAPAQFDICLPPKLYILIGSQYYFYEDSIIRNSHIYEKKPISLALTASRVSDGATITPFNALNGMGYLSGSESYNLTMSLKDYSNSGLTAVATTLLTKAVSVTNKAVPTGKSLNILAIGDSYVDNTYGDGFLKYLKDFATASGNTLNFKGGRTSYGIQHEARAGWSESTFFRYVPTATRIPATGSTTDVNMSSPFMFSPDDTAASAIFDFSQYLSVNNIGTLDIILIFLGMNGGDGTKIDQMITSMKAARPNVKILVNMVPSAEKGDRANSDSIQRQIGRLNQNDSYIAKFAGREASGIYLVPTHINFHRVYSLINGTAEQIQFNLNGVPTRLVNTDHHWNASGCKGGAYLNYNYVLYVAP